VSWVDKLNLNIRKRLTVKASMPPATTIAPDLRPPENNSGDFRGQGARIAHFNWNWNWNWNWETKLKVPVACGA